MGEHALVRVEAPLANPRTLHVCASCMESFDRWVARPSRRGGVEVVEPVRVEPLRRRVKQTDIAEAMISRRRSRGSKQVERQAAKARREMVKTVIAWMLGLSVLIVIIGAVIYLALSAEATRRRIS